MEKGSAALRKLDTRSALSIAMLSAVAFVLAFAEFPVPLSPSFAKFDLSDLPAMIGAFAFGPIEGIMIELIKNLLRFFSSTTGGIGELANFLMGASFVGAAGLIYERHRTKKAALIGCLAGSTAMAAMAAAANYFILLPLFETFMPVDRLIASFSEFLPFIRTKFDIIFLNALPFNLLKGFAVSAVTILLYKRLSPILKGRQ